MEVVKVLHMNGGLGDTSYASNSLLQKKVTSMTTKVREEAITEFYKTNIMIKSPVKTLCIAELGCSTGPNTLFVATEVVRIVDQLFHEHGHDEPLEFQIHLNDLCGNDFNSIFQYLLPKFEADLRPGLTGPCFVSAVPGSVYGRLFPSKSLHFVHSSYCLMWLSKVPEGLEMNEGNIYLSSTSPKCVIDSYYKQFQSDFSTFLKCRSEEVVAGGKMVVTVLGRKSDDPCSKEGCYIWVLLGEALQELVAEGVIEKEKLRSFNIPEYIASPAEVRIEVEKEGSFTINRLEASEIMWAACGNGLSLDDSFKADDGYNVTKCMRSVSESLLVEHFGEPIIDRLFDKYKKIIDERMSKEDPKFINVTVSMTRK